jgi:hypothetical protein
MQVAKAPKEGEKIKNEDILLSTYGPGTNLISCCKVIASHPYRVSHVNLAHFMTATNVPYYLTFADLIPQP